MRAEEPGAGSFIVGVVILAAGVLAVPSAGGAVRALLETWAGGPLETPAQSGMLALAMVWIQNGVWFGLSLIVLHRWGWDETPSDDDALGAVGAALGDVLVGAAWGLFLVFVNALTSRLSLAVWERVLPADQLAERVAHERGMFLQLLDAAQPQWLVAAIFLTVVLIAPLGEEVLFRGVLHRGLMRSLGGRAAWVSGALFAVVHLYTIHFLSVWLLGVLLARLYERRGSLVAPIVAHGVVNGLVALVHMTFPT